MVGLAVLGCFSTTYYTTTNTLLQLIVPGRMRGRVMSLYILTSTGFIPLGNILAGVIAERIGAPTTLAGMVSITLAVCAFVACACRRCSPSMPTGSAPEPGGRRVGARRRFLIVRVSLGLCRRQ